MKKILYFVISLFMTNALCAKELTPDEALNLALNKLKSDKTMMRRSKAAQVKMQNMRLVHTEVSTGKNLYYVFEMPDGGFVIASADDRAEALLGYTDNGEFADSEQNPAFKEWLQESTRALAWLSMKADTVQRGLHKEQQQLDSEVEPLLGEIKWGQDYPYNMFTPIVVDDKGENPRRAPVGCLATTAAQLMKYYKWPKVGTGSHTHETDSTITIDFSQSVYDWDNMANTYSRDIAANDPSAISVAKLMRDLGCALNMTYDYYGSNSYNEYLVQVLSKYFGYNKKTHFAYRWSYTSKTWNDMLRNELNNRRPICYSGVGYNHSGHSFIIDGYATNGLYHVNWGWYGNEDGYYNLNIFDPYEPNSMSEETDYPLCQNALFGLMPDYEGNSVAEYDIQEPYVPYYDEETKTFNLYVNNYGTAPFTGIVGWTMTDTKGDSVYTIYKDYAQTPLLTQSIFVDAYSCSIDSGIVFAPGYRMTPFYADGVNGEHKKINGPIHTSDYMICTETDGELTWIESETIHDYLEVVNLTVVSNIVGYEPEVQVTITNTSDLTEYEGSVVIYINDKEDERYCYGRAPLYLMHGDTATVNIKVDYTGNIAPQNLEVATYDLQVTTTSGNSSYILYSDDFSIEENKSLELTYKDIRIDKTDVMRGDTINYMFNAHNTGGNKYTNFYVLLFPEVGDNYLAKYTKKVSFKQNRTNTISIPCEVDVEPGRYVFICYKGKLDRSAKITPEELLFTVQDGMTALDEIQEPERRSIRAYDLQGRSVETLQRGGLYIVNGKKVVVD